MKSLKFLSNRWQRLLQKRKCGQWWTNTCSLLEGNSRTSAGAYDANKAVFVNIETIEELKAALFKFPQSSRFYGEAQTYNRIIAAASGNGVGMPLTEKDGKPKVQVHV